MQDYGLLTRESNRLGDPIPVYEFVAEAEDAHCALTLYEAVRARDTAAIRRRIKRRRIERHPESGPGEQSPFAEVFVDGEKIPFHPRAEGELTDEEVVSAGAHALETLVNEKLAGVRFHFGEDFEHPRPLAPYYMPVLGWNIPNLLTAAWFQFAWIMSDSRPLSICPYCGEKYPVSKSNQQTCGKDRCRKKKSRQERAQR